MCLFGIGDGIGNLSVIKNCWRYFPNNTALINGVILGGLGLSSAVLTPIADYIIINPQKVEPTNGIYLKNIADKVKNYLYFLLEFFFILGCISILLTFNYIEEKPKKIN